MRFAIYPLLFAAALFLSAATAPVFAGEAYVDIEQRLTAEQMKATGLDTLSLEQLALLNRLLQEDQSVSLEAVRAEAQAEVSAQIKAQHVDAVGGDGQERNVFIGLNDEPIHSRISGPVSGWAPGDVFRLENGQQWKVLKGSIRLRKPLDAPQVVVVPGISGRWFLQFDEDLPKARVYRID